MPLCLWHSIILEMLPMAQPGLPLPAPGPIKPRHPSCWWLLRPQKMAEKPNAAAAAQKPKQSSEEDKVGLPHSLILPPAEWLQCSFLRNPDPNSPGLFRQKTVPYLMNGNMWASNHPSFIFHPGNHTSQSHTYYFLCAVPMLCCGSLAFAVPLPHLCKRLSDLVLLCHGRAMELWGLLGTHAEGDF